MANTDQTEQGNSGPSIFIWCAATASLVPLAYAVTYYFGGREIVDVVGRFLMLAGMWTLLAGGICLALLAMAVAIFGKERDVPLLCFSIGGAVGCLLFSGMLWFMNYPLHSIGEDIRARVSQVEGSN